MIQTRTENKSSTGHATYTYADQWQIRCRIAPAQSGEQARGQINTASEIYDRTTHDIALAGYYPQIDLTMRVEVHEIAYDIVRVDHDDQHGTTVLRTRRVD